MVAVPSLASSMTWNPNGPRAVGSGKLADVGADAGLAEAAAGPAAVPAGPARSVAPWVSGRAVVVRRGGCSGRGYGAPVTLFRGGAGRLIVALSYGPGTDWGKQALDAGGCQIRTRGRVLQAGGPRVYRDET